MSDFHLKKLDECAQVFRGYLTKVTVDDEVLAAMAKGFESVFHAALTDDASTTDRFGEAAWALTSEPLKAQVRKLAALAEYHALEDHASTISRQHVREAMTVVRAHCPVTTMPLRKRRLDYCGDVPDWP